MKRYRARLLNNRNIRIILANPALSGIVRTGLIFNIKNLIVRYILIPDHFNMINVK